LGHPIFNDTIIEGGKHWSLTVRSGITLRMLDMSGGANVGMLLYNPFNLLERYNAPDTLKCQHTFKLTKGHCLYTDMGRIFCSITEDSVGWHDTVGGNSTKALVRQRWGERTYQSHRNGWTQNGHDSFLVEAAKYGLSRRDLAANVNWFSKVAVDAAGAMTFDASNSTAGARVDLRFEMDTLVLLHTCPHPMNTAAEYPRGSVRMQLQKAAPVPDDDPCRNSHAENVRGFANTELYRQCTCEGV
jgi:uncharacterized protein